MLLASGVMAQTRTLTGLIRSGDDNQPLPGANIIVTGTSKGTTTDLEGRFSLGLEQGENSISVSFVGYKTSTIDVTGRSNIEVSLELDADVLEDVVVIGYGVVKKSDLTGAVSSVRGNDLVKVPSVSPLQALQGKVPGVQVTSTSGAPGAGVVVRIRGTGTFNNASPIYVVDGVILDNIDFLNSSDIQSMEILKDASASAIYGSRGANGVVVITTKAGTKGQGAPSINFSAEYSIQKLQKKIDLLSGREFAIIANEITPGKFNNVDAVPNTDWQDLLYQTAPIQNYQVSASGGSESVQYYVGVGYFNQEGIIPKSNYERITLKFNNTYSLSKNIRLGNNLTFTPYRQQNTNGNAPFVVYRAQPTTVPFATDGSYNEVQGVGNVLADLEYTNSFNKGLRTVGNFYGEVDFLKGFTFKSSIGIDMEYNKNESFTPVFYVSPQQQNSENDLRKGFGDRLSWLWENTLNYTRELNKHRVAALAGFTMQESSSESISLAGENIIRDDPDFWYLNQDNIVPSSIANGVSLDQNYALISYLFRVNYTYNDRYLFTATYRVDQSSKFSKNNRTGGFPSVALGWNVVNENFMAGLPVISNLKLRASWGILGNEKILYNRQYSRVINGVGGVFGNPDVVYPGSSYGVTGNPDLVWESTNQTDIGVELGFFNDRLTAEIDYYNKRTEDILIDLPVPGYLGNGTGAAITYNAAEVLNRGIEYNIRYSGEYKGIRYQVGTLGTTIHNEAIKVMGTGSATDRLFNGAITTSTEPGLPLGAFYGYKVDGIFQNQGELDAYPHRGDAGIGDLRYVDVNGDNAITGEDRTYIGSPIPTFLYGANVEVGYKGISLALDFQGQSGNKILNSKETVRPDLYNFEQHVFDRWTGEGTSTTEPRSSQGGYNFLTSSRFVQDGSFFRLRSVTLNYDIPVAIAEKLSMKSARVYLRGTNVFTISNFTGYSPEVTSNSVLDNGIDNSTYPISTIYSAGLNVTF